MSNDLFVTFSLYKAITRPVGAPVRAVHAIYYCMISLKLTIDSSKLQQGQYIFQIQEYEVKTLYYKVDRLTFGRTIARIWRILKLVHV